MEQDTPPADFDPRDTHAEMAVLRVLVETMLSTIDDDVRVDVVIAFRDACEELKASLLASPLSDLVLQRLDRAIAVQQDRLVHLRLAAPSLFGDA